MSWDLRFNFGASGCFSAHLRISARKAGVPRNPIKGIWPVAGRPLFFCLTNIVFFIPDVYQDSRLRDLG
jgi:hypothetical protein